MVQLTTTLTATAIAVGLLAAGSTVSSKKVSIPSGSKMRIGNDNEPEIDSTQIDMMRQASKRTTSRTRKNARSFKSKMIDIEDQKKHSADKLVVATSTDDDDGDDDDGDDDDDSIINIIHSCEAVSKTGEDLPFSWFGITNDYGYCDYTDQDQRMTFSVTSDSSNLVVYTAVGDVDDDLYYTMYGDTTNKIQQVSNFEDYTAANAAYNNVDPKGHLSILCYSSSYTNCTVDVDVTWSPANKLTIGSTFMLLAGAAGAVVANLM